MIPTEKRQKPIRYAYEIGERVKIYKGAHEGESGTVTGYKKPGLLPFGVCYIDMIPIIELDSGKTTASNYTVKEKK